MKKSVVRECLWRLASLLAGDYCGDTYPDIDDEKETYPKFSAEVIAEICILMTIGAGVIIELSYRREAEGKVKDKWFVLGVKGFALDCTERAVRFSVIITRGVDSEAGDKLEKRVQGWEKNLEREMLKYEPKWHQVKEGSY